MWDVGRRRKTACILRYMHYSQRKCHAEISTPVHIETGTGDGVVLLLCNIVTVPSVINQWPAVVTNLRFSWLRMGLWWSTMHDNKHDQYTWSKSNACVSPVSEKSAFSLCYGIPHIWKNKISIILINKMYRIETPNRKFFSCYHFPFGLAKTFLGSPKILPCKKPLPVN